jgi:hypothetical protein
MGSARSARHRLRRLETTLKCYRAYLFKYLAMTIPAVKLIPIDSSLIAPLALAPDAARTLGAKLSSTTMAAQATADLRWSRVEEFLRSRELRPNTRKSLRAGIQGVLRVDRKGLAGHYDAGYRPP